MTKLLTHLRESTASLWRKLISAICDLILTQLVAMGERRKRNHSFTFTLRFLFVTADWYSVLIIAATTSVCRFSNQRSTLWRLLRAVGSQGGEYTARPHGLRPELLSHDVCFIGVNVTLCSYQEPICLGRPYQGQMPLTTELLKSHLMNNIFKKSQLNIAVKNTFVTLRTVTRPVLLFICSSN